MYRWMDTARTCVIREVDRAQICASPDSRDYQDVLAWVANGNEIAALRDEPIDAARAKKIASAWSIVRARVESRSVSVSTSAGTHVYGLDPVSQENVKAVLLGVALSVTPNPRPWTPRGETTPVQLTHADLTAVGAAMMAAVDAEMQAYLGHKAAILQCADSAAVAAYDVTSGWPS